MWFWFFVISGCINLVAAFYIRWLIKVISAINQDIENVSILISDFTDHTKSVYELEMFYGDDTLKSLMTHASELSDQLKNIDLVLNEQEPEEKQLGTEEN